MMGNGRRSALLVSCCVVLGTVLVGCINWNFDPQVTVTSPNGGEDHLAGSALTVTWECSHVDKVKIELSRDGGATWETLADSVSARRGTLALAVTGPASENCLVRVSDVDGAARDESDAAFSISLPPPQAAMAQITEAGAYIVPGSANNTVRYTWDPPGYDPDSVMMEVVDNGGTVVRTISGLPLTFEAGQSFAEHRWNGCADETGIQPLTETGSPYTVRLTAWWSGQESSAEAQALVEEWLLDIGIEDAPGGTETLVSGPDERSITGANLEVRITLDGNPAVMSAFSVTANTEVAGGPAANERGCLVTPDHVFYTTPKTPHDIRYQVVVEQNTATSTVAPDGLLLSTVVDGALNPWDMDPTKAGRQTRCTWEFGLDSSGSPPAAVRRELVEAYEP